MTKEDTAKMLIFLVNLVFFGSTVGAELKVFRYVNFVLYMLDNVISGQI
jgi:hypothetical protein